MSLQADFMAGVVKDGPNNLGMLIMPQFTYHKGQLAVLEQQALQMIMERRISADNKFALPFAESSVADQRDGRPLFYDGRVLVPANLKKDRYLWKDAPLLKGRVETAKQLAGKDMVQVVDVSDTALPSSTDLEGTIRGAARWSQLGTDAYLKLLDAALLGLPPNTRTGILVVSLTVGVGHCFQAWVQKRASLSVPFYYMGVCEDGLHVEWLMREETQRLKVQHLEGTLKVPGCAPATKEIPPDLLEAGPKPPVMVKLVLDASNPDKPTISVPKTLVQGWVSHMHHGADFAKWMEEFTSRFEDYIAESPTQQEPTSTPTKLGQQEANTNKRSGSALKEPQSAKKPRTMDVGDKLVPLATATEGVILFKAPLVTKGKNQSNLIIKSGNQVFLTNESDKDMPLPAGYIVAGFGRGKYRHNNNGEVNMDTAFSFQLQSSEEWIMHQGNLVTVREVVQAERKKNPTCKVAYHDITEQADAAVVGGFTLQTSHQVCFVPNGSTVPPEGEDKDDPGKEGALINRVAALIPKQHWVTHCTEVLWFTKWGSAGLTPVRPVVVTKADLVLPAGKALAF